ncbi:MAG: hypothetical protein Q8N36_03860 [bacterium]|nr:hypothetical protein [bacterium]
MKKMLVLTMLLIIVLATPSLAALKILEPALALELETVARQHVATTKGVDLAKVTISDAWLQELFNTKNDVYVVNVKVNDVTEETYVQIANKKILTAKEYQELVDENIKKAPSEPQTRTMSATAEEVAIITTKEVEKSKLPNYLGGMAVFAALGAVAFLYTREPKITKVQ